jgi:hypothetical protein
MTSPVFILGMPRTGSKLVQYNLNNFSDFCIINEAHVLSHKSIRFLLALKDYRSGATSQSGFAEKILSKYFEGGFWWADEHAYTVFSISHHIEKEQLASSPLGVLEQIMNIATLHYDKKRSGARHLVNIIFLPLLLKRFKNCRIIILHRKLIPIIRSKNSWYKTDHFSYMSYLYKFSNVITSLGMFLVVKFVSFLVHRKENVMTVHYEHLISKPDEVFRNICSFLSIPYTKSIARLDKVFDSSYNVDSQLPPDCKDK